VHVLDGLPVRLHVDALAEAGWEFKQKLKLHGEKEEHRHEQRLNAATTLAPSKAPRNSPIRNTARSKMRAALSGSFCIENQYGNAVHICRVRYVSTFLYGNRKVATV
jgi:hypothetical protein